MKRKVNLLKLTYQTWKLAFFKKAPIDIIMNYLS